jgi:four helix bundle protein
MRCEMLSATCQVQCEVRRATCDVRGAPSLARRMLYESIVAKHFRELSCWQLASELKVAVYAITDTPAARIDRSFCDDARRAARSGPANIAEGFGRYTHREFAQFLSIARASLVELENHLQHAFDIKAIDQTQLNDLTALGQRTQRSVSALRTYLLKTKDRNRTPFPQ